MDHDRNAPPLNPLPPVVWLLVLPIALGEIVLGLADAGLIGPREAIGWRVQAIERLAFSGALWDRMLALGLFPPDDLLRLVSYPFVHWGTTHALIAGALALALGKFVGEVFRALAVLAVFFAAAAIGAAAYGSLANDPAPLIGAYPGVYGLIGALTFILWTKLGEENASRARAFILIGALAVYQIGFGLFGLLVYGQTDSFWLADLAGFGAGFLLSFVVSPGGWARVLAKLRQP